MPSILKTTSQQAELIILGDGLVFERTRSGTFVQNDVIVQFAIPGLPFGGAGPSGYGSYHGKK